MTIAIVLAIHRAMHPVPGQFIMIITRGLAIRGDRMRMLIFGAGQSISVGHYPYKLKV